jgi:hypothetical protein
LWVTEETNKKGCCSFESDVEALESVGQKIETFNHLIEMCNKIEKRQYSALFAEKGKRELEDMHIVVRMVCGNLGAGKVTSI